MNLTREEAIRFHRDMWTWIAKQEEGLTLSSNPIDRMHERYELKREYLNLCHIDPMDIESACFLCEYSLQQARLHEDPIPYESQCRYCPLDWGDSASEIPCQYTDDEEEVENPHWVYSPAEMIANLPERNFILEELKMINDRGC